MLVCTVPACVFVSVSSLQVAGCVYTSLTADKPSILTLLQHPREPQPCLPYCIVAAGGPLTAQRTLGKESVASLWDIMWTTYKPRVGITVVI